MITAVDTNILLDILVPNEEFITRSGAALERAAGAGVLVSCEIVYAELCTHFRLPKQCDCFLRDMGIRVEPLGRASCHLASQAWRSYRRRGGKRKRILPDFLIGAHAITQANCLLSRDRGFYREAFPDVNLIDPAARQR